MTPMIRGRRGFTFIELMTVWCIIAILAAILFPVFARAREKARQTTCMSNFQNIGAALKMYGYDNYGHLPPSDNDLTPLIGRELFDAEVLLCPTERREMGRLDIPEGNPGRVSDYVYRGGLCDDDTPTQVIAGEKRHDLHNGGSNCLWLDGHAKWFGYSSHIVYSIAGMEELDQLREPEHRASNQDAPMDPGIRGVL
jgi:prepilin-type processing-associated H-X9-DG protein/prepilin-type N-terminal cleavage/methylation domain-containing protein